MHWKNLKINLIPYILIFFGLLNLFELLQELLFHVDPQMVRFLKEGILLGFDFLFLLLKGQLYFFGFRLGRLFHNADIALVEHGLNIRRNKT